MRKSFGILHATKAIYVSGFAQRTTSISSCGTSYSWCCYWRRSTRSAIGRFASTAWLVRNSMFFGQLGRCGVFVSVSRSVWILGLNSEEWVRHYWVRAKQIHSKKPSWQWKANISMGNALKGPFSIATLVYKKAILKCWVAVDLMPNGRQYVLSQCHSLFSPTMWMQMDVFLTILLVTFFWWCKTWPIQKLSELQLGKGHCWF